jgi:hypothetical protein
MIPYEAYKVMHLVGVFMVVAGLAAMPIVMSIGGGNPHGRRLAAMTHGGGLAIALLAGFGMLARLHLSPGQGWVIGKLVIWLALGGMIAVAKRQSQRAGFVWILTFILAGTAGYLAIYKP